MPYSNTSRPARPDNYPTSLELGARIIVQRTVVIQNIDKLEIMPYANFIIIGIVCRRDLDGTSSKRHVDDNRIGNDWDTSIKERMDCKFAMQMLSSGMSTGYIDTGSYEPYTERHQGVQR